MRTFAQKLEKYAELAVKVGANVQEGQEVLLKSPIDAGELARLVAEKAYQAGAKRVYFNWTDDRLDHLRLKYAAEDVIGDYPVWKAKKLEDLVKRGAACIDIRTTGIGIMDGIDPKKAALDQETMWRALNTYYDYRMSDRVSWTILIYPTVEWAKKLFPGKIRELAVADLWEVIFKMTRVDREDPIDAWEKQKQTLANKVAFLNKKKYKQLHYKAPGTDLKIAFDPDYHWDGGAAVNSAGTTFVPNIPTEEVYTLPLKSGVNGTVMATRPLVYGGKLIENLSLTFKEGRIISVNAKEGEELLNHLIDTDEGAHYLGEVALVPNDSPISQSGLVFYTTLYDENASCHLAIGKAYPTCLDGGTKMSAEELAAHGANTSLIHVDFMIGSDQLDIDGENQEGEWEPVFRNGEWAF
ncbi:aminopeptidase [Sporolactobacillus inulinus]|uniref:Aminopeptidase S n=2 Tax=Sporolactobacillus inulinus TaxID=2078 RepID=A0A4Y1ZEK4_9BACL|nr:aminopeptidase [Sporolactobacillus inulinus]KLI02469.1 peptidase M29 [Sporolactobacillus inulinus CASD]GAY77370.1 aminopeptidase S [Sporolactobacillus inulinus]GEB75799.1 aminopeptidase [Sporolactobacillus inulinus]